jgi:hypothetical protein
LETRIHDRAFAAGKASSEQEFHPNQERACILAFFVFCMAEMEFYGVFWKSKITKMAALFFIASVCGVT